MRSTIAFAVCAAAVIFGGAHHAMAQNKPEKASISIGAASTGITYLPVIIAKELGYFKEQGIDMRLAAFSGGSKALEALIGGSVDLVAGAYSNTLTMATKGQKLVTIVAQVNCPGWIFGVAKKSEDKVKQVSDLNGKRIGVSAPGSSTHMAVNFILHKAGVKPDEVAIIGVGQAAGAVAAIRAGQIDALIVNDPVATLLTEGGDLKPLAEMRSEEGNKKVFGADYPESSIYSTKAFIDNNPNLVQAVANAIVKAEHWMNKATPQQVVDKVPDEYVVEDRKLYVKAYENSRRCISRDGMLTEQGTNTVREVLSAFEPSVAAAKIDMAATYDNSYAKKAAELVK